MNKKLQELKQYYEKILINKEDNDEKLFDKPSKEFLTIVKKISKNSVALDLGYGAGLYSSFLLKNSFKVIAVDMVDAQILIARNNKYFANRKLIVLESDINSLSIYTKIDLLICRNVLHYISRDYIEKSFKNIINNTNNNGYHYIVMFTDIKRKTRFGTDKIIPNESNYSTQAFLELINELYKNWEIKIIQNEYSETNKKDEIYFQANQITVIAKKLERENKHEK